MRPVLAGFLILAAAFAAAAADLPVKRVVLYKNGVAWFERSGEAKAGEPVRLDFKAAEMDDVLKSLIVEASGGAVARVRYELNEPLERRLEEQGIRLPPQLSLALLLDQWRGAKIDMKHRGEPLAGTIVGGRLAPLPNQGQRQELTILASNGELRVLDLDSAANLKLTDSRLQSQLEEALAAIAQSRSREKRAVFVDLSGSGARNLTARYVAPSPIWKSSYRLLVPDSGEASLEGWAIVDNASGEEWANVDLTVVSGKPVSFVSRLYEPKYIRRLEASLAEDQPAAPVSYEGALRKQEARVDVAVAGGVRRERMLAAAPSPPPPAMAAPVMEELSGVEAAAEAREAGELFEYHFATPVTARKGESLLLPFVQQKIQARKLLVYSDRSSPHPRNAAELVNSTGKTLDGGPLTVYQPSGYSGEALMETLKSGDKRLISYAVDQGTRVTTNFDSSRQVVRSMSARRGVLTSKAAVETTTTYTVENVDAKEKALLIQHPVTSGQKLVKPKPDETSANHYRFAVNLAARGNAKLAVVEEQEISSTTMVSSMTPDMLMEILENKSPSPAAKKQLAAIVAKKNDIAAAQRSLRQVDTDINEITRDQDRLRQNLNSLNRVQGQQEQVQRYVNELAAGDARLARLRDQQAELRKKLAALENELNTLIESLDF